MARTTRAVRGFPEHHPSSESDTVHGSRYRARDTRESILRDETGPSRSGRDSSAEFAHSDLGFWVRGRDSCQIRTDDGSCESSATVVALFQNRIVFEEGH